MSLLPPKVTLMSVSTSNTYMKLQNFRKLGKNAKLSKKRTLPISGQNLFPQWCPLIRDYTVLCIAKIEAQRSRIISQDLQYLKCLSVCLRIHWRLSTILKASNQTVWSNVFICKIIYNLKIYSIPYTLR